MKNQRCPFCNINPERTKILKEGLFSIVIFSNPRLMPGHILIVPKRHIEKFSELKKEEKEELLEMIIEFQEKILRKISSGCDIKQNYRPFQKENDLKVNHLHIHLQPRELFDELYEKSQKFETDIFEELTKKELKKYLKLFKDNN
jgi:diadenosine tetraphosphate (Ap4A) HIT family hydrolase